MFARRIALVIGLAGLGATQSGSAQRVSADIHIGSGPVDATIRVGDRPDYRVYGRPRRAYAEVVRPVRVVVERRHGWNPRKHRNGRVVVVYYDRDSDLYFDRHSRGLEEVRVYQDDRRYYRYDDFDRYDWDGRRGDEWGRRDRDQYDRDRYDRDRNDRDRFGRDERKNRDWYHERNGNRNKDRREHDHQR